MSRIVSTEWRRFNYRTPRVHTSFPVVVQSDPQSKPFSGQCLQVSGNGMALVLPQQFAPGKELTVIVDRTRSGKPLTLNGVVVHSGSIHGVRFRGLSDVETGELETLSQMP